MSPEETPLPAPETPALEGEAVSGPGAGSIDVEAMRLEIAQMHVRFVRRIARTRKVALLFLPLYIVAGISMGTAIALITKPRIQGLLVIAFVTLMFGQWFQPYWLERLHKKAGDRTEDDK